MFRARTDTLGFVVLEVLSEDLAAVAQKAVKIDPTLSAVRGNALAGGVHETVSGQFEHASFKLVTCTHLLPSVTRRKSASDGRRLSGQIITRTSLRMGVNLRIARRPDWRPIRELREPPHRLW